MIELPRGWERLRLKDIAKEGGGTIDPRAFPNETFDLFSIPSFSDGVPERVLGIDIGSTKQRVQQGDVLLSKIVPHIRRVWVVPRADGRRQIASGEWIVYRSSHLEPHFIRLALSERSFRASFLGTVSGVGGSLMRASPKQVAEFSVPFPPLAEQKRIVAKLDALNAKSARARTELARIETLVSRYKQAVLSKAFSGELTREWREINGVALLASEKFAVGEALQKALSSRRGARTNTHQVDFNAVAAIPSSWAHAVVGVGADMTVGFAFKSEWFRADGVKLLRGANIAPRAIDWSELKCLDASRAHEFARYLVEENDIVLAMDRPVISTGLKVARVAKQDAGCLLVQRVTRFRASEFVAQDFLWWFLNTQMFLAHSLHRATGSDLPHISGDDIATCPLPVPPLQEQHEIVRRIESAFAKIDRLAKEAKRALELVGRLDEAILAKAFRGELVPQDENDEPAEHLLARIRAERAAAPKGKRGLKNRA